MTKKIISLSEPIFQGNEKKYLNECISTGWVTSGKFVNKFEKKICKYVGSKHAIALINATSAIQISLKLAGVKSGDEVLTPTLTFIAPINAIIYNCAEPIFMDCDNFYNIDQDKTIEFIENKTYIKNNFTYNKKTNKRISAVIIVHIFGNPPNIYKLKKICNKRNIEIIEDASESLGSFYKTKSKKLIPLCKSSKFACLSFNGNKIITSGGGGMIITNNAKISNKARYLISQAKDDNINYIHKEIGYNFRISNLHAAIGLAQFEKIENFLDKKRKIHEFYKKEINKIPGLSILDNPEYAYSNNWLNILQINHSVYNKNKKLIIKEFKKNNIEVRPVWYLNHLQRPYISKQKYKIYNSIKLHKNSICLPSSHNLSKLNLKKIIKCLKN